MKKIIALTTLVFLSFQVNAQEIQWMSLNEALAAQEKEPKKIIMDVYTNWCGPCKMMAKKTFKNEDVVDYINKNYYAVKFNAEGNEKISFKGETYTNPNYVPNKNGRNARHEFSRYMGVRGYPTLVFFDSKGDIITPIIGYKTPEQLEIYLKMVASNDYKQVKTREDWVKYRKNFEGAFQN